MAGMRSRIEKCFEDFTHIIYRNPIKTILFMLLISAALTSQIPNIVIDTSMEGFLHENDPAMLEYNAFRDQFGRDEVVIIALKPAEIFNENFFNTLQSLHEDLEKNVPYIDDITSLINARNTRGQGDVLIVEDLLEKRPVTHDEMMALKQRVLSNPLYRNLLISEDGRFTAIIIRNHSLSSEAPETDLLEGFDDAPASMKEPSMASGSGKVKYLTDQEIGAVVAAVDKVIGKYRSEDFPIWIAGSPVVMHFLKKSMMQDMRKFMVLAMLAMAILLFILFRRVTGVLLPLFIVIVSLFSTVGIMSICSTPIKVPTQILPSFLLAVGIGTSVHILSIFFHRLRTTDDKEEAIAYSMGHSGLAVVMANVTTASGLMSFSTAEVAPVADLGIYAGIGVILTFINSIILLPALLALAPIRQKRAYKDGGKTAMGHFLSAVGHFSTAWPKTILCVSAVLILFSTIAISNIRFSHHTLNWFPKDNDIRLATEKIDHELKGSLSLEVVLDTGIENGLYEPDLLNRMEQAVSYVKTVQYEDFFVGKAWSLTTILKEINQALNENRSAYYHIPQDRDLVAQEFLLFENSGSDDLEDFVDSQFSKARIMIKVPYKDAYKAGVFIEMIDDYFLQHFPDVKFTLTGMVGVFFRTLTAAVHTMAKSYAIALVVITALMILLIGKVRIGLLSMIPNLVPILLTLGVIGAFSIPMDLFTMMVASIAIGLAVDDTIHFMHNFRRYYEEKEDPVAAVHETLQTTGRAMLVTTVALSLGFFIFGFSTLSNVRNFGLLTGFAVTTALTADYLIAPALMVIANRAKTQEEV